MLACRLACKLMKELALFHGNWIIPHTADIEWIYEYLMCDNYVNIGTKLITSYILCDIK
jgi:hypothetical protein